MQTLPNGKLQVRWREAGKQLSRTFLKNQKREAARFELIVKAKDQQIIGSPNMLFRELTTEWIENYCKTRNRLSQVNENSRTIEIYLLPEFGERQLCTLDRKGLEGFQAKLKRDNGFKFKRPLKPKSINHIIELAKKIMKTGVEWGYIPSEANHWKNVKKLKDPKLGFSFWEARERDLFLANCYKNDPDFARAVAFSVHTGLRLGELSALLRKDIDFERALVRVEKSYSHKYKVVTLSTKNDDIRQVPLNNIALEAVKSMRMLSPTARLFGDPKLKYGAITLRNYAKAYGITSIRWHDLRHTVRDK